MPCLGRTRLLMTSRYASLKVNYMTIPVYVVGAISLSIQVCYSDKLKRRGVFIMACCVPVAVGYLICVGTPNAGAGYAGMFVLVLGKQDSSHHVAMQNLTIDQVSTPSPPSPSPGSPTTYHQTPNERLACLLPTQSPTCRTWSRRNSTLPNRVPAMSRAMRYQRV